VARELGRLSDRVLEYRRSDFLDQQRIERPCEIGCKSQSLGRTLAADYRRKLQQAFGRINCRWNGLLVDRLEGAADALSNVRIADRDQARKQQAVAARAHDQR